MSGTRLQQKSTAVTHRFPKWAKDHYYTEGSIVWQNDYDSDQIDLYVSLISHTSNDSDYSLYLKDSENDSDYYHNETVWSHWKSSRILDSDEMSYASLSSRITNVQKRWDSDQSYIDSDVQWLEYTIPLLPDSESIDSDLRAQRGRLRVLEEREVFQFIDSDAKHNQIIVWDSDNDILVTKLVVRSLNTFGPDGNGNIPISFIKILSGTKDDKPDSETDGTIYVINNDSDSEDNGVSFIYNIDQWKPIVAPDRAVYNKRYLKSDGTNKLIGPLYVTEPTNDTQIVTKRYVDVYVKEAKENQFGFFDSERVVDTTIFDSENFIITTDEPTIKFFDKINTNNIGDVPISDYEYFDNVTVDSDSDYFSVDIKNFSSFVTGNLELRKDGVLEPFTLIGATYTSYTTGFAVGFKIDDSSVQNFIIQLSNPYSHASEYIIKYHTHYGETVSITKSTNDDVWNRPDEDMDYGSY